ncbi:MAG TPA: non-homologous end-joining DNA ligase [Solirubrobacterales bacterium]|nr:non-homologous end-joining DNA ligase [Solirubrobacterales bacterium]
MAKAKTSSALEAAPRERMPPRLEPMLAKPGPVPESDSDEWAYEIKWDGVRVLAYADRGEWCMLSRRLEDVSARYPELEPIAAQLADHRAILDGEVVALDSEGRPRFQLIQSRMGLTSAAAVSARMKQTPVDYVIFDLLHLDGHCVRDLPYLQRRELLEGLGLEGPRWRTPRYRHGDGADLLEAARRQGLEGIVAKRCDSPYRPGKRTGEWIKTRVWQRQEFVIGGYIPGEGRRAKRVGSLLVGYYDRRRSELGKGGRQRLHFAGGVGSGLKEDDLDFLTRELGRRERPDSPFDVGRPSGPKGRLAVWCEPELVCEVSWTEWTDEGTLRQPAFKGMRDDKDPREVVREF